jgi:hypothetical protein
MRSTFIFSRTNTGNVPRGTTEAEIEYVFEPFGQVKEVWVAQDPRKNGFAFVEFESFKEADNAVYALSRARPHGWVRYVKTDIVSELAD